MKVPFLDLKTPYKEACRDAERSWKALAGRGDFVLGQDVRLFEKAFAKYCGARFSLGVNSGTDALFLGLLSLGIGSGDEVIVPVYTYIASAYAVSYTGAKPVFVDIDEQTYALDASKIKKAVTVRTKAIMPVHLYGQAADMGAILTLAKKHGLKVIEDAAQAHGTEYDGEKAGALGDIGAFSFYPTKNLGAFGDGGMVVTNNRSLYDLLYKLRDYGRRTPYEHIRLGYNSRLDSLQAIFLYHKLKHLDRWNRQRIQNARFYHRCLKDRKGILLPSEAPYGTHVYHIFAVRVKKRDKILKGLNRAGIAAMVHYPVPLHLQEVYRNLGYHRGDFPVAERVCREILCLPMHPYLTKKQIEYVSQTLIRLVNYV